MKTSDSEIDWILIEYGVAVFSKNVTNTDPEYYEERQMPKEAHLSAITAINQYCNRKIVEVLDKANESVNGALYVGLGRDETIKELREE